MNGNRYSFGTASDGRYILFEDLSVWDTDSGAKFFLLDDAQRDTLPMESCCYSFDPLRGLLTLQYTSDAYAFTRQKVIIDCANRKIVARYCTEPSENGVGFKGCLIEDRFWLGTETGIVRLPFPQLQPVPKELTKEEAYERHRNFIRAMRANTK